ncbi:hypothetical protein B6U84_06590 [Candidatus Bathyarchaeota archaeon ex4484_40]|nr:MAG: hypothetical protein B6U84_06590 [Candidatus Bathyarchaeota archaeon ex4484_40]
MLVTYPVFLAGNLVHQRLEEARSMAFLSRPFKPQYPSLYEPPRLLAGPIVIIVDSAGIKVHKAGEGC